MGTNKKWQQKDPGLWTVVLYRRLLRVSWKDKTTNNWVLEKIDSPSSLETQQERGSWATLATSCVEKKALKSRYFKGLELKDVEEEVVQ